MLKLLTCKLRAKVFLCRKPIRIIMEQPDFKEIAGQLRHPKGETGLETARRMAENNAGMIRSCIDQLSLKAGDNLLEIGPGGGAHLPYLLSKAGNLHYTGADISETMIHMATEAHRDLTKEGTATFLLVTVDEGCVRLPYESNSFNPIFTVNTIYFWDDAPGQAREIYRVLQPGGTFAVCFATEAFMQSLPFTRYDFNLYTADKARALLEEAGFQFKGIYKERETVYSNAEPLMERDFIVMLVTKPTDQ